MHTDLCLCLYVFVLLYPFCIHLFCVCTFRTSIRFSPIFIPRLPFFLFLVFLKNCLCLCIFYNELAGLFYICRFVHHDIELNLFFFFSSVVESFDAVLERRYENISPRSAYRQNIDITFNFRLLNDHLFNVLYAKNKFSQPEKNIYIREENVQSKSFSQILSACQHNIICQSSRPPRNLKKNYLFDVFFKNSSALHQQPPPIESFHFKTHSVCNFKRNEGTQLTKRVTFCFNKTL